MPPKRPVSKIPRRLPSDASPTKTDRAKAKPATTASNATEQGVKRRKGSDSSKATILKKFKSSENLTGTTNKGPEVTLKAAPTSGRSAPPSQSAKKAAATRRKSASMTDLKRTGAGAMEKDSVKGTRVDERGTAAPSADVIRRKTVKQVTKQQSEGTKAARKVAPITAKKEGSGQKEEAAPSTKRKTVKFGHDGKDDKKASSVPVGGAAVEAVVVPTGKADEALAGGGGEERIKSVKEKLAKIKTKSGKKSKSLQGSQLALIEQLLSSLRDEEESSSSEDDQDDTGQYDDEAKEADGVATASHEGTLPKQELTDSDCKEGDSSSEDEDGKKDSIVEAVQCSSEDGEELAVSEKEEEDTNANETQIGDNLDHNTEPNLEEEEEEEIEEDTTEAEAEEEIITEEDDENEKEGEEEVEEEMEEDMEAQDEAEMETEAEEEESAEIISEGEKDEKEGNEQEGKEEGDVNKEILMEDDDDDLQEEEEEVEEDIPVEDENEVENEDNGDKGEAEAVEEEEEEIEKVMDGEEAEENSESFGQDEKEEVDNKEYELSREGEEKKGGSEGEEGGCAEMVEEQEEEQEESQKVEEQHEQGEQSSAEEPEQFETNYFNAGGNGMEEHFRDLSNGQDEERVEVEVEANEGGKAEDVDEEEEKENNSLLRTTSDSNLEVPPGDMNETNVNEMAAFTPDLGSANNAGDELDGSAKDRAELTGEADVTIQDSKSDAFKPDTENEEETNVKVVKIEDNDGNEDETKSSGGSPATTPTPIDDTILLKTMRVPDDFERDRPANNKRTELLINETEKTSARPENLEGEASKEPSEGYYSQVSAADPCIRLEEEEEGGNLEETDHLTTAAMMGDIPESSPSEIKSELSESEGLSEMAAMAKGHDAISSLPQTGKVNTYTSVDEAAVSEQQNTLNKILEIIQTLAVSSFDRKPPAGPIRDSPASASTAAYDKYKSCPELNTQAALMSAPFLYAQREMMEVMKMREDRQLPSSPPQEDDSDKAEMKDALRTIAEMKAEMAKMMELLRQKKDEGDAGDEKCALVEEILISSDKSAIMSAEDSTSSGVSEAPLLPVCEQRKVFELEAMKALFDKDKKVSGCSTAARQQQQQQQQQQPILVSSASKREIRSKSLPLVAEDDEEDESAETETHVQQKELPNICVQESLEATEPQDTVEEDVEESNFDTESDPSNVSWLSMEVANDQHLPYLTDPRGDEDISNNLCDAKEDIADDIKGNSVEGRGETIIEEEGKEDKTDNVSQNGMESDGVLSEKNKEEEEAEIDDKLMRQGQLQDKDRKSNSDAFVTETANICSASRKSSTDVEEVQKQNLDGISSQKNWEEGSVQEAVLVETASSRGGSPILFEFTPGLRLDFDAPEHLAGSVQEKIDSIESRMAGIDFEERSRKAPQLETKSAAVQTDDLDFAEDAAIKTDSENAPIEDEGCSTHHSLSEAMEKTGPDEDLLSMPTIGGEPSVAATTSCSSISSAKQLKFSVSLDDLSSDVLTISFADDCVNISSSQRVLARSAIDVSATPDGNVATLSFRAIDVGDDDDDNDMARSSGRASVDTVDTANTDTPTGDVLRENEKTEIVITAPSPTAHDEQLPLDDIEEAATAADTTSSSMFFDDATSIDTVVNLSCDIGERPENNEGVFVDLQKEEEVEKVEVESGKEEEDYTELDNNVVLLEAIEPSSSSSRDSDSHSTTSTSTSEEEEMVKLDLPVLGEDVFEEMAKKSPSNETLRSVELRRIDDTHDEEEAWILATQQEEERLAREAKRRLLERRVITAGAGKTARHKRREAERKSKVRARKKKNLRFAQVPSITISNRKNEPYLKR